MKILVCISCVPDTTSKISFTDKNKFNSENVQFIIGPYEDYALARAVELKEKNSVEFEMPRFYKFSVRKLSEYRKAQNYRLISTILFSLSLILFLYN